MKLSLLALAGTFAYAQGLQIFGNGLDIPIDPVGTAADDLEGASSIDNTFLGTSCGEVSQSFLIVDGSPDFPTVDNPAFTVFPISSGEFSVTLAGGAGDYEGIITKDGYQFKVAGSILSPYVGLPSIIDYGTLKAGQSTEVEYRLINLGECGSVTLTATDNGELLWTENLENEIIMTQTFTAPDVTETSVVSGTIDVEDPVSGMMWEIPYTATVKKGGFDFGQSCEAGQGEAFVVRDMVAKGKAVVGSLPSGRFDIEVDLTALNDLDVVLYDAEECITDAAGQCTAESKAIIQYCSNSQLNSGFNCGLIIDGVTVSGAAPITFSYKKMLITYSGYNGDQMGNKGNEYIRITGMSTTELLMQVYAYKAGDATVNYSWGAGCGGAFDADLLKNERSFIGSIPSGKNDLLVVLDSVEDVDVQLYDETVAFAADVQVPLKAIVAYCGTSDVSCNGNKGLINTANSAQVTYPDTERGSNTYLYSGYNGLGPSAKGQEWIEVVGTGAIPTQMWFYGYAPGVARVFYAYDYDTERSIFGDTSANIYA